MPNLPVLPTAWTRDNLLIQTAASPVFLQGAPLLLTAGVAAEAGANPALIAGFAAEPGTGARLTVVLPDTTHSLMHRATEGNRFWITTTSDGTTLQAPVQADVGATFGITKGTDGIWTLDRSKNAANQRVFVHQIDAGRFCAEVSVLAANRQLAP
jgi:hypothetical protein